VEQAMFAEADKWQQSNMPW